MNYRREMWSDIFNPTDLRKALAEVKEMEKTAVEKIKEHLDKEAEAVKIIDDHAKIKEMIKENKKLVSLTIELIEKHNELLKK